MPEPQELQALLSRIEAATGPDHDLDVAIGWTIERNAFRNAYWNARLGRPKRDDLPDKLEGVSRLAVLSVCPHYTDSIDAALALVERVLGQHWLWEIKSGTEKRCILWMLETDYDDRPVPTGWHAVSIPLAILAALLRALTQTPGPTDANGGEE